MCSCLIIPKTSGVSSFFPNLGPHCPFITLGSGLDHQNSFPHIAFGIPPGSYEKAIVFGSAFSQPRFKSVGPIGDSVYGDCIQQAMVKELAEGGVVLTLQYDHGLKGFERLKCSLETDRSRFHAMFDSGLCCDRPDEVVGQDVRPEFLPDKLWGLATQDVYLQRFFQ